MVSGGLSKQDVTIADATAAARLTLWESDVHSVREGRSYELSNLVVRSYLGDKYLSMPKEGAQIKEIDDIGDVHEDDEAEQYITESRSQLSCHWTPT
jgi:ssDNA-binding replication factor A large subunit